MTISRPSCRSALALRRGLVHARRRRWLQANACFLVATQFKPRSPTAHFCLGRVAAAQGQWGAAVACFRESLRQRPNYPPVLNRLGLVLENLERWNEAVDCYLALLRRQPHRFSAYRQLSHALTHLGRFSDALQHVEQALALKPADAGAHVHRALLWLQQGDFLRGWAEYEWRWQRPDSPPRPLPQPRWTGDALAGRTILLHAEQGLGDTLQFIRYAAVLRAGGARVVLECPRALACVLSGCDGVDAIVETGTALPPYEVHAPLMSLPHLLGLTAAPAWATRPYLRADPALVETWRARLGAFPGFRVGVVWQGNPAFPHDQQRSIPLAHFAPLTRVPGVRLVSLQKHDGISQLADVADQFAVVDLGAAVDESAGPFMDTAAILKNLDLVIACDSAVAHLAGALGVPVWLALATGSDWRWLLDRPDTPWYPAMRLFRQREPGNWPEVFSRLAAALTTQRALSGDQAVAL